MSFAPGELLKLCTELLGGQFVDVLGEILDVNPRTIQRWLSGKQEVPIAIEEAIREQWSFAFEREPVVDRILFALTDIEMASRVWRPVIATQARTAAARFLEQDAGAVETDDVETGPRPR